MLHYTHSKSTKHCNSFVAQCILQYSHLMPQLTVTVTLCWGDLSARSWFCAGTFAIAFHLCANQQFAAHDLAIFLIHFVCTHTQPGNTHTHVVLHFGYVITPQGVYGTFICHHLHHHTLLAVIQLAGEQPDRHFVAGWPMTFFPSLSFFSQHQLHVCRVIRLAR